MDFPSELPGQHQEKQPGAEWKMNPRPIYDSDSYAALKGKFALITGGDSGIGRAGQPIEVAPSYVFLASEDSLYIQDRCFTLTEERKANG